MLKKDESTSSVHITNHLYNMEDGNYNNGFPQSQPPQRYHRVHKPTTAVLKH